MIFGEALTAPASARAAEWLSTELGRFGTVGGLVPPGLPAVIRIHPPAEAATDADWWDAYRSLFVQIVKVGQSHTRAPGRAWFAIWEGHGFASSSVGVLWGNPASSATEAQQRAQHEAEVRKEARNRARTTRDALNRVPRFELPNRAYYLLSGHSTAIAQLQHPDGRRWQNPDLVWVDDRSWFIATDVDIWSLYVGGSDAFIAELETQLDAPTERVESVMPIPRED
jgi:hypothetical protein